jgi:hypothetical protein
MPRAVFEKFATLQMLDVLGREFQVELVQQQGDFAAGLGVAHEEQFAAIGGGHATEFQVSAPVVPYTSNPCQKFSRGRRSQFGRGRISVDERHPFTRSVQAAEGVISLVIRRGTEAVQAPPATKFARA